MTPWELSAYADAYADQQRQTAYLQGLTIRAMIISGLNGKRAPSFDDMFGVSKSENETMDDDDLFRAALAMNKVLGGETIYTEKEVS